MAISVARRDSEGTPLERRLDVYDRAGRTAFTFRGLSGASLPEAVDEACRLLTNNLLLLFPRAGNDDGSHLKTLEIEGLTWVPSASKNEASAALKRCLLHVDTKKFEWWITDLDMDMIYEAPTPAEDLGTAKRLCLRAARDMGLV